MKRDKSIKINMSESYKLGIDEVVGLKAALLEVFQPVVDHLNELDSWSGDDWFQIEESEYKSRDGFIPNSHNCGGLEVRSIVPKCGEYAFGFLDFGEYSERKDGMTDEEYDLQRDSDEEDGQLDAGLHVWLKFEGFDSNGKMQFYLYAGGGNGDAPYFRTEYQSDLFEASFTARTLKGIKRAASKHVCALIKELGGK